MNYSDTTIVINTLGRVHKQITFNNMPESIQKQTYLSVQKHEFYDYPQGYNIIQLPEHIKNLPETRQWLIDNIKTRYLLIMDDDLSFNRRRDGNHKKLHKIEPIELEELFDEMHFLIKHFPMVGVSSREGNNREEQPVAYCTRSMRIFMLDLEIVRKIGARFDRTKTKEDMDMTLQLLRAGYKNAVIYSWSNDQVGSNTAGGCATYRTNKVMEDDAHLFASLHPGFVQVVKKQTKTSWGGQERTDVRVQWKKAYMSSLDRKQGEVK